MFCVSRCFCDGARQIERTELLLGGKGIPGAPMLLWAETDIVRLSCASSEWYMYYCTPSMHMYMCARLCC